MTRRSRGTHEALIAGAVACAVVSACGASTAPDTAGASHGPTLFSLGTICNDTGQPLAAPRIVSHVIVFMFENENFDSVNGDFLAPYASLIASRCGYTSNYLDNCFDENLVSLPHYLALTSGSNCVTGLGTTGSGCIVDDADPASHRLTTSSIFDQVPTWRAYEESMPSACAEASSGAYACKHNPPAYFSSLDDCDVNDVSIAPVSCDAANPMSLCTTPYNALTRDLANDTLPAYAFVTPNLDNDMHSGTVTQGDNWLYTYLSLVLASRPYLNGEVVVFVLWDEQSSSSFGGPTPNLFVSPYIRAGTAATVTANHFAALRAMETLLGISSFLGCAGGAPPGGGACPPGSSADLRGALNF